MRKIHRLKGRTIELSAALMIPVLLVLSSLVFGQIYAVALPTKDVFADPDAPDPLLLNGSLIEGAPGDGVLALSLYSCPQAASGHRQSTRPPSNYYERTDHATSYGAIGPCDDNLESGKLENLLHGDGSRVLARRIPYFGEESEAFLAEHVKNNRILCNIDQRGLWRNRKRVEDILVDYLSVPRDKQLWAAIDCWLTMGASKELALDGIISFVDEDILSFPFPDNVTREEEVYHDKLYNGHQNRLTVTWTKEDGSYLQCNK
ncbi:hypothetical protein QR680_010411 [Steinernema hermaphroditum]|uniref:Uncharacterized protein n=1 Tax=Steinernema hermaphroditum TaxID=289476 RepID=A0AA39MAM5_9BILA|nr:hypothetical protein QR680_010411 [Steinernema hermaphroditum]